MSPNRPRGCQLVTTQLSLALRPAAQLAIHLPTTTSYHNQAKMGGDHKECVMTGMYCTQFACTDDLLIGCDGAGEFLCLEESCCAALNDCEGVKKPVGMIAEEGFFVKCGLFCCTMGAKKPDTCFAGRSRGLCCVGQGAFPPNEKYIKTPVCAICFVACLPEVGLCIKPPNDMQTDAKPGADAPVTEMVR